MIKYKVVTLNDESYLAWYLRSFVERLDLFRKLGLIKKYSDGTIVEADPRTIGLLVYDSENRARRMLDCWEDISAGNLKIKKVEGSGKGRPIKWISELHHPQDFLLSLIHI